MNEWEAKYKLLAQGMSEEAVEIVNKIVEHSVRVSRESGMSLWEVLEATVHAANLSRDLHKCQKQKTSRQK